MSTLIVMGDLEQAGDPLEGTQLWRIDFLGWDVVHRFLTEMRCVPRRYILLADGQILAAGRTDAPHLAPGETFRLSVSEPEAG
ncbi:DUF4981 domain-containing protein [Miltoncostaea oceani]|uniref:DUF4981 domain-containing protein n=1 Tax=Miltoncostaea oceani TaxID=2843216 RepID=UPI001C3D6D74|nr:DUF4981 domain-containing protein [Miltoncostaea oceani]